MHEARRKKYLQALEIGETWVPRSAVGAAAAAPAPVPAEEAPAAAQSPKTTAGPTAASPPLGIREPQPAGLTTSILGSAASRSVPTSWDGLREAVADCRACRLCETRTQTVFGVGPAQASLMVIGEGPGADEDAQGEPFVGRAGKLLDEMLRAIGQSRQTNTYIANVVKCRPPGNREPAEDEAEACRTFLEQQLRLVQPRLIVALGRVAAQRLLMTDEPLSRLRGRMHQWGPEATPLLVTYHPAYLLRSPGEKAKSWQDLKTIHRFLAAA